MEGSKSVLVLITEHRHVVCFSGDLNNLKIKVKEAFGDMIPDGTHFFFQVKHEGWGGQFVDTKSEKNICHKLVLKVIMENEVFTIPFVNAVQLCSFSLKFIVLCHLFVAIKPVYNLLLPSYREQTHSGRHLQLVQSC